MDKIMSTRIDEAVVRHISMLAYGLGTSGGPLSKMPFGTILKESRKKKVLTC